ncbi:MAG: fimbrillin family protein [Rikenellaceae bacterium]
MKKLLFCLSALFAVACTEGIEEDVTLDANTGAVNFEATMTTRATDTEFENGDEISVVAYSADGTAYAQNVLYTYSGALFSSDSPIMKTESSQELSYLAVYPYTTIGDDKKVNFSVQEDQSAENNYTLSDLLSSSVEATSSTSPQLIFTHLLSKLVINIDSEDVTTADAVATLNAVTDIEYNLESAEYTTSGDVKAITMASDSDTSYKALLVPQVIAANSVFGSVVFGGTTYEFTFGSDITIESGYVYTLNATIVGDKITFGNAIINDWNEVILEDTAEDEVPTLMFSDFIALDEYKNLSTIAQITAAINYVDEGDVIQFDAGTYYLPSDLSIYKGVTLQGVGVTPTPDGTETEIRDIAGAGEIETTFKLSGTSSGSNSIIIYSDDVTFRHLRIEGYDDNSGNVVEFKGSTRNFLAENVYFYNGAYHLSPRDAMSHALKCYYTTFDNFKNRGFFINRKNEDLEGVGITLLEKCEFYRCKFDVWDPQISDTRAISLDAGNNENPNILDFDGLEVRECYFYDIGFASSKCCNFNIIDCEFYVKDLFDFPLHMEEYSYDINITGCKFICEQDQTTFTNYADAMMGVIDNSVIENNIVEGSCYGFVQGRYAEGMVIRNNDLSNMTNLNSTNRVVSFWDADGSRDITVENNDFPSGSVAYIRATSEDKESIVISGNSNCTSNISITTGYDWPLEDDVLCRIKHDGTGEYLQAAGANADIVTTTTPDEACNWRVTRVWPNRYNVYNEKYDTYLYIEFDTEGYSTAALALAANIAPETKQYNSALERVPIWDFTEQNVGSNIIGPGGGNHGCLSITSSVLVLLKETTRASDAVTNEDCFWSFELDF